MNVNDNKVRDLTERGRSICDGPDCGKMLFKWQMTQCPDCTLYFCDDCAPGHDHNNVRCVESVEDIMVMYNEGDMAVREIAERLGLAESQVYDVINAHTKDHDED